MKQKKNLEEHKIKTEFMPKIKNLYETCGNKGISSIEIIKNFINDENFKKTRLTKSYFDYLNKIIDQINQNIKDITNIIDLDIGCMSDCLETEIPPGAYELIEINNAFQQELNLCNFEFIFNIVTDTISMRSVLTTSSPIYFNSELNTLLGSTNFGYPAGNHKSEKPVMITTINKIQFKCDCVDGSNVNGIREHFFSFNLSAAPRYKIIKEPNIILF